MVHVHDLGVAALTILGLAFLIGWNSARLNQATLLWGIAHLALAGATFTGHRSTSIPHSSGWESSPRC